jgi:hypothetical protein
MRARGLTFANACRDLGAWDDAALDTHQQAEINSAHRRLIRERAEREIYNQLEHDTRIRYRDEIHTFESILRSARTALREPDAARADIAYIVALTQGELREVVAAYYILSLGNESDRHRFVEDVDARQVMMDGVLCRGYVQDDDGKIMELAV